MFAFYLHGTPRKPWLPEEKYSLYSRWRFFSIYSLRYLQIKIDQFTSYSEFCIGVSYLSVRSGFSRTPVNLLEHVKSFQIKSYNMMINVNRFYLTESSYLRIHVKGLVLKIVSEGSSLLSSPLTHSIWTTFSPGLSENFLYAQSLNHFWLVPLHKGHLFFQEFW